MSPKGPLFGHLDDKKAKKDPSAFFGNIRLFQNSHFLSEMSFVLDFLKISTENFFSIESELWTWILRITLRSTDEEVQVRKHCAKSDLWRYIRIKMRFTKEEADIRKRSAPLWHSRQYPNFWRVLQARRAPLGVSALYCGFFSKFHRAGTAYSLTNWCWKRLHCTVW